MNHLWRIIELRDLLIVHSERKVYQRVISLAKGLNISGKRRKKMTRICMNCGKNMGEKKPLKDKSETHGICINCLWVYSVELALKNVLKTINYSSELGLEMLYMVFRQVKILNRIKKFRDGLNKEGMKIKFVEE